LHELQYVHATTSGPDTKHMTTSTECYLELKIKTKYLSPFSTHT